MLLAPLVKSLTYYFIKKNLPTDVFCRIAVMNTIEKFTEKQLRQSVRMCVFILRPLLFALTGGGTL